MTQQNMQVDEFDISDAPEAPSGVFVNYGKLTLMQKYMVWKNGATEEASKADWAKLPSGEKQIDMVFTVNIQEFKPSLSFTYERKVRVDGLDWNKIVAPSIEAVFGKGSMAKDEAKTRNTTLGKLNGKYVAYQDVPQTPTKKNPDPKYSTFKLVKVFDSREACLAEFNSVAGGSNGATPAPEANDPNVPSAYSREDWNSLKDAMVGEVDKAIADALAGLKSKAPPAVNKARADAKTATIKKLAGEYEASEEQVKALIGE